MFTIPIDDVSFEQSTYRYQGRCASPVPFSSRCDSETTTTRAATPDTLGRRLFEGYVRSAERQQAHLLTPMVPQNPEPSDLHESIEQLLTCIQDPLKPSSTVQCLCHTIDTLLEQADRKLPSYAEITFLKSKIEQLETLLESRSETSFVQFPDELEPTVDQQVTTKPRHVHRQILTPSTTSFGSKTQTPMCPADLQLVSKQLFPPVSPATVVRSQIFV